MNIGDIKERVNDNKTSLDCDLDDLSDCVEYLLSVIEQQEKTMSLFANNFNWNTRDYKGATVYEWGLPSKPMELAEEALQAIRKGD